VIGGCVSRFVDDNFASQEYLLVKRANHFRSILRGFELDESDSSSLMDIHARRVMIHEIRFEVLASNVSRKATEENVRRHAER